MSIFVDYIPAKMKITRNILFCLAILLIFINTVALMDGYGPYKANTEKPSEIVGFYIGLHIFFLLGIIFLIIVFALNRKIKKKKMEGLNVDIDSIGQDI